MVSFRLPSSKKLDVDDAASTSSSLPEEALGPATPDGVAAAAGLAPKYWPTREEVEALLQRLPEQDRQQCDVAMANRWVWPILGCSAGRQRGAQHGGVALRPLQWCMAARPPPC